MVDPIDIAYFREREIRERALARDAADPTVAAIHRRLADEYAARTNGMTSSRVTMRSA
jgi:hypothetical protein